MSTTTPPSTSAGPRQPDALELEAADGTMRPFGQAIRSLREACGMSQPEVVTLLAQHRPDVFGSLRYFTLGRWERADPDSRHVPTVERQREAHAALLAAWRRVQTNARRRAMRRARAS